MSSSVLHGVEHISSSGSSYYQADCLDKKCDATDCPSYDIDKCMLEDASICSKLITWFRHEDVAGVGAAPKEGAGDESDGYGEKQKGECKH
jgi:hypothetical protein